MAQEQKTISAREFKEKVEAGYKKPALAEYFGIPVLRVTQYLQQLELRIKATKKGGSILVMDLEEENPNQTQIEFPEITNNIQTSSEGNDFENTHNVENNLIEESNIVETATSL